MSRCWPRPGVQRFVNGPIAYSPDALPLCGPAAGAAELLPRLRNPGRHHPFRSRRQGNRGVDHRQARPSGTWRPGIPRRFGDWATEGFARARAVELYGLQYAIPYPHRILSSARPLQRTPLYDARGQGRGLRDRSAAGNGRSGSTATGGTTPTDLSLRDDEPWREAVRMECEAVRDRVGVMDHGGIHQVRGPRTRRHRVPRTGCSAARVPKVGRVKLSYMLTPKGMIRSEATIARLAETRYLLCGPTLAERRDFDWLGRIRAARRLGHAQPWAVRKFDAALMVMGPLSRGPCCRS